MDQDAPGLPYALLGLVKRWGPARVEEACAPALAAEAVSVALIGRMIERATEAEPPTASPALAPVGPARFARDIDHFATKPSHTKGTLPSEGDAAGIADRVA